MTTVELDTLFVTRLFVAGTLGALVGLEREFRAKEAGLRTHFLVALGSALIMLVSQYGFMGFFANANPAGSTFYRADISRIAAQIVSGIGFIGAGAIMVQRHTVSGLTTAAALWVVAGIGMAAGCGHYVLAVATTFFTLLGLELFRMIVGLIRSRTSVVVFTAKTPDYLEAMLKHIRENGFSILNYRVETMSEKTKALKVILSIRDRGPHPLKGGEDPLITLIRAESGVHFVSLE